MGKQTGISNMKFYTLAVLIILPAFVFWGCKKENKGAYFNARYVVNGYYTTRLPEDTNIEPLDTTIFIVNDTMIISSLNDTTLTAWLVHYPYNQSGSWQLYYSTTTSKYYDYKCLLSEGGATCLLYKTPNDSIDFYLTAGYNPVSRFSYVLKGPKVK